VTCGDYRVLTTNAHGLRVQRAPGIPHALCFSGRKIFCITRAHRAARSRSCVATLPAVIVGEGGRSSIPETLVIEPRSRSVLDTPHARGMTTLDVIARSEATKQSIPSFQRNGLLRGACHRARIRATRWLAMTVCNKTAVGACIEYERATLPAFIAGERACEGY
jgi:hypothetical protein